MHLHKIASFAIVLLSRNPESVLPWREPLPPKIAPSRMTLPAGLQGVSLFAGEPDVVQPIAFIFDDRGQAFVEKSNAFLIRNGLLRRKARLRSHLRGYGRATAISDSRTVFYDKAPISPALQSALAGLAV